MILPASPLLSHWHAAVGTACSAVQEPHPPHWQDSLKKERAKMLPSLRPILLVAAASLWWSAAGVLADGNTSCLCTSPQCTLPCPGPPAPATTTLPAATQFPFCPPRPPSRGGSIAPFPWAPAPPRSVFPQDPGFLESAAYRGRMAASAWLPVVRVLSAFLVLLQ